MSSLIFNVGLIVPRVVAAALYFLGVFEGVFSNILWPIAGIVFMPTTFIAYGIANKYLSGDWGPLEIGIIVVGLLIDLGPAAARRKIRVAQ